MTRTDNPYSNHEQIGELSRHRSRGRQHIDFQPEIESPRRRAPARRSQDRAYNIKAVHNCFANTYTFFKDGVKFILTPSHSSTIGVPEGDKQTLSLVNYILHIMYKVHTWNSHE